MPLRCQGIFIDLRPAGKARFVIFCQKLNQNGLIGNKLLFLAFWYKLRPA